MSLSSCLMRAARAAVRIPLISVSAAAPVRPAAAVRCALPWGTVLRRDYNVNGNEVKAGSTIRWEDKTWLVLSTAVNMRGRAHTTYNLDLKDVSSTSKISVKVRPADKIEVIEMSTVRMNYLYRQGNSLFFMDPVSFEQVELDVSLLPREQAAGYLIENSSTVLKRNGETFVSIAVPEKVVCTVEDTPSGRVKQVNDTSGKEARLTNGLVVQVPNFIENGTHIIINTATDAYVGKSDSPPAPEVEQVYN